MCCALPLVCWTKGLATLQHNKLRISSLWLKSGKLPGSLRVTYLPRRHSANLKLLGLRLEKSFNLKLLTESFFSWRDWKRVFSMRREALLRVVHFKDLQVIASVLRGWRSPAIIESHLEVIFVLQVNPLPLGVRQLALWETKTNNGSKSGCVLGIECNSVLL